MGRHSAGDADLDVEEVAEPSAAVESSGRHAHTDEDDADQTVTEPIDLMAAIGGQAETDPPDAGPAAEPVTSSKAATREREAPSADQASVAPRAPSGTRGDLKLLRQSAALRARCIGGVVAIFLIYTVALIVLGRTDVYLLWVWIPTVLSGILVGSFLDAAHR